MSYVIDDGDRMFKKLPGYDISVDTNRYEGEVSLWLYETGEGTPFFFASTCKFPVYYQINGLVVKIERKHDGDRFQYFVDVLNESVISFNNAELY